MTGVCVVEHSNTCAAVTDGENNNSNDNHNNINYRKVSKTTNTNNTSNDNQNVKTVKTSNGVSSSAMTKVVSVFPALDDDHDVEA